jgi:hypothetical protein
VALHLDGEFIPRRKAESSMELDEACREYLRAAEQANVFSGDPAWIILQK